MCLTKMWLKFWPGFAHGSKCNPPEDGHFKEARFLDGHECIADHLLSCEWGLGDNQLHKEIFEAVMQFIDRVTWVSRGAMHFPISLLLPGGQPFIDHAQLLNDISRSSMDLYIFSPIRFPTYLLYFLRTTTFSPPMIAWCTFILLSKHILLAVQTFSGMRCPVSSRVPSIPTCVGPGLDQFAHGTFELRAYGSAGLTRPENPKSTDCIERIVVSFSTKFTTRAHMLAAVCVCVCSGIRLRTPFPRRIYQDHRVGGTRRPHGL